MRLLLVEDEPRAAQMLAKGLREQAYAIDVARNGNDAPLGVLIGLMAAAAGGWIMSRFPWTMSSPVHLRPHTIRAVNAFRLKAEATRL